MKTFFLVIVLLFTTASSFAEPLPAEKVFKLSTQLIDPNTFTVHWTIKPGYFLYQSSIHLSKNNHLGPLRLPKALTKTDPTKKSYNIYRERLSIPVNFLPDQSGDTYINVYFQGCSDAGFCYPPQENQIKLTINNNLALSNISIVGPADSSASLATAEPAKKTDTFEQVFSSHNWFLIILTFFGFGLLLAFTPCVLPMVPILSGLIVGHSQQISTRKAFLLSLSYVLSMAITYSIIGAVIALMGKNLQLSMQSPWAISFLSLIFFLLALSMFNLYELRLPNVLQNKLAGITRRKSGGHYLNAAFMGSMSILILSPCVTAPLIGALSYIAHTGDIVLGILSLFFLSLGMGTPLLLIGASAGKLLPKTGQWMNLVKAFFGILLIGVAIYLLSRIIPAALTMILWGSLFIFTAIFLGLFNQAQNTREKIQKGFAIIILVYGILILIGGSLGHTNLLRPLSSKNSNPTLENLNNPNIVVSSINEAQLALKQAKGKPVMLDFYADWCASCKIMAATTLNDARILEALQHVIVIKVDLTANDEKTRALLNYFKVVAPPTFIFFNKEGHELNDLRIVGEIPAEAFYEKLQLI